MKKEDLRWAKNEWIGEKIVELCNYWHSSQSDNESQEAYSLGMALWYLLASFAMFIFLPCLFGYLVIFGCLIPLYQGVVSHPTESLMVLGVIFLIAIVVVLFTKTGFYSQSMYQARIKEEKRRRKKK